MAKGQFPFQLDQPQNRGGCLSILLAALMGLYALASINFIIVAAGMIPAESMPSILTPARTRAVSAVMLTCAIGMFGVWRSRRWGIYVFGTTVIAMLGVDVWLHEPYFLMPAPVHVTVFIVVLALIWNKWASME